MKASKLPLVFFLTLLVALVGLFIVGSLTNSFGAFDELPTTNPESCSPNCL